MIRILDIWMIIKTMSKNRKKLPTGRKRMEALEPLIVLNLNKEEK